MDLRYQESFKLYFKLHSLAPVKFQAPTEAVPPSKPLAAQHCEPSVSPSSSGNSIFFVERYSLGPLWSIWGASQVLNYILNTSRILLVGQDDRDQAAYWTMWQIRLDWDLEPCSLIFDCSNIWSPVPSHESRRTIFTPQTAIQLVHKH